MSKRRSVIIGTGSYLPQTVLSNADLAARLDTSDEWIIERTGIRRRHICWRHQHIGPVPLDEGPAAPNTSIIGHNRTSDVSNCAGQGHSQHRELARRYEIAGEGHDDLAGQGDTGAFNGHGHEDAGVTECRNHRHDKSAQLRNEGFDQVAHRP